MSREWFWTQQISQPWIFDVKAVLPTVPFMKHSAMFRSGGWDFEIHIQSDQDHCDPLCQCFEVLLRQSQPQNRAQWLRKKAGVVCLQSFASCSRQTADSEMGWMGCWLVLIIDQSWVEVPTGRCDDFVTNTLDPIAALHLVMTYIGKWSGPAIGRSSTIVFTGAETRRGGQRQH